MARKPIWSRRDRLVNAAREAVRLAVKDGRLPEVTSQRCKDCAAPATCYDHRDYTRALQVDPVCKKCNNRRGPGWPYPDAAIDGQAHKLHTPAGVKWANVDGGEGFEPLSAQLIAPINVDELSEHSSFFVSEDRYRLHKLIAIGDDWTSRADYFKAHDPWAA